MTDLRVQRRMAAELLGCGVNRVWIDDLHTEDVAAAITRDDIRRLISQGVIEKGKKAGTSRGRARERSKQKKKGRQRGPGKRQGAKGARNPRKQAWVRRIRAIRDELKTLRSDGVIEPSEYRHYYRRAKGGVYNSRAHLLSHMKADGAISDEEVEARRQARKGGDQ